MFYILKKKKKLATIFNTTDSWTYNYNIVVKDVVLKINTNNHQLSNYIKNTYHDFITKKEANYYFNFYNSEKNIKEEDYSEDEIGVYSFIRFFDTFFYYRNHKSEPVIDVLLPRKFEFWEFENFFKIFISSISLSHNSLLIHASAIIINEEAVLFSGQSGAGKSTIAELSNHQLIHDDNILISFLGNGIFELETIPFKIPYQKKKFKGKIKGFYRIFQNDNTFIKEINSNIQLSHLLFGLWAFNHFDNENSKKYNTDVINYCTRIVPHLNIKELYFTKNTDFLKLI